MVVEVDIVSGAKAAVLEVGPGKTYSTIQAAVDAAQPGNTIALIHRLTGETVCIYTLP